MKLLVANWKTNPLSVEQAVELAKAEDKSGVVICPPFLFLTEVKKILTKASLGAQDVFWGNLGAYTGEVSWRELEAAGVSYVIVGHSERRNYLKETDELINNKLIASLEAGLKVILCVGESQEIRNKGINHAKLFVEQQLDKDLIGLGKNKENLIIAYEPIWAIGTGESDTPENAAEMALFIKKFIRGKYDIKNIQVLYGGSVNRNNAYQFMFKEELDGALIGGASLKADDFNYIIDLIKK